MKSNWTFLLGSLIIVIWKLSIDVVNAFVLQQQQQSRNGLAVFPHERSVAFPTSRNKGRPWLVRDMSSTDRSSSTGDDSFDEDELSKLIGKRNQIKRMRKPAESATSDVDDDTSLAIPLDNINLDELPAFSTQRPVRQRKRDSDDGEDEENGSKDSRGSADKRKDTTSDLPYLDYLAEYADENEFHIPNRMGFSTRAWGDASLGFTTVPAGKKLSKTDLRLGKFVAGDVQVAFNQLMQGGVVLGETSEAYGVSSRSSQLSAEHILAQCLQENPNTTPLVSTTMANNRILANLLRERRWPYSKKAVTKALTQSCQRLELASVELYQVSSLFWGSASILADGLAQVVEQGLCNHVGIQHANRRGMQAIRRHLDEVHGIQLISNAFRFSLTNRRNEKLIEVCKDMGVIPLIQLPLDVGDLASGRYTATNPSGGQAVTSQRRFKFAMLEKLQPLHSVQETVAERVRTRVIRETRDAKERTRGRYGPPVRTIKRANERTEEGM